MTESRDTNPKTIWPRRKRRRIATLGAAAAALAVSAVAMAPSAAAESTIVIEPGQSWAEVLSRAPAGSTVEVADGDHGYQTLEGLALDDITVEPARESGRGVDLRGVKIDDTSGLTFERLSVRSPRVGSDVEEPQPAVWIVNGSFDLTFDRVTVLPESAPGVGEAGIEICSGSRHKSDGSVRCPAVPPHDITISRSVVDGAGATGLRARGVLICCVAFEDTPPEVWPYGISIVGSEIMNANADLIQVAGGRDIDISDNLLHDVVDTSDHNDAVQSYGSDGLRVSGNRIWDSEGTPGGPDQAIILGSAKQFPHARVRNSVVENNIIDGTGQGITVSGVENAQVVHNTSMVDPASSSGLAVGNAGGTNTGLVIANNIFSKVFVTRTVTPGEFDASHNVTGRANSKFVGTDNVVADLDFGFFAERLHYTLSAKAEEAIGTGTADWTVGWDYDGDCRAQVDRGAQAHTPGQRPVNEIERGDTLAGARDCGGGR